MRTVFRAVAVALILAPLGALSQTNQFEKCGSAKRITCVVDGDTIWFEGEKIRIMGCDTPEPTTDICGGEREKLLAAQATQRLIDLLNSRDFSLERHGLDRYDRRLANLLIDGVNVADILVSEGLARTWPDGPEFWCE